MSRRLGESGTVFVDILVDEEGRPQQMRVRKSSGFDRLDQAAMDGMRKWRFKPGLENGQPRSMWVTVPFNWKLN